MGFTSLIASLQQQTVMVMCRDVPWRVSTIVFAEILHPICKPRKFVMFMCVGE